MIFTLTPCIKEQGCGPGCFYPDPIILAVAGSGFWWRVFGSYPAGSAALPQPYDMSPAYTISCTLEAQFRNNIN